MTTKPDFSTIDEENAIYEWVADAHRRARAKGWWNDCHRMVAGGLSLEHVQAKIPEKLCLMHGEISKALELYRLGELTSTVQVDGKPEGFPTKLADICIRVFDLAGALGIDLGKAIADKSTYNETRPYKHGGRAC